MDLTYQEWKSIETEFRVIAGKWARLQAQIAEYEQDDSGYVQRYLNLANAAKSPNAFETQWKKSIGSGNGLGIVEEFREKSKIYDAPYQLIKDALRYSEIELQYGPQYLQAIPKNQNISPYEGFIEQYLPEDISLTIDHAYYALYIVWRPDAKIIIPDNQAELLRAMAVDEALFRVISPRRFEELVAYMYECLGCRVELTQQSRDFGADILVWHAGPLESETLIAVQVKKYAPQRKVGLKGIFELHGAVTHYHAHTGQVVTTSNFTKPARDFAIANKYHLVSLEKFQEELLKLFGED